MRWVPFILCAAALLLPVWAQEADEEAPSAGELIGRMAEDDYAGRAACEALIKIGEPAVTELIAATEHAVPRVRYWSVAALSGIGDDRAAPAIRARLKDPDGMVRAVSVWHVGKWYDTEGVRDDALALLKDPDEFVRGWALKLIVHKKDKAAAPRVAELLKDRDEDVRYDALHAYASLLGAESLETLKRVLREDASALVRECAVRCCTIVEPPTPRTAEVLILALGDAEPAVRGAAARLLRKGFDQVFDFDPEAEEEARHEAAGKWRAWYAENKDRLTWDAERRVFVVGE